MTDRYSTSKPRRGQGLARRLSRAALPVYLRQLALTNFRNYARLGLNLSPGVTVFHGENAQGKSNLLEAIHVLATSRSPRATLERPWGGPD